MNNYYKVMGLKQDASENEIKSAYRLLAKRYHPDVNPGNAAAAEKFAAINEAYNVLIDPQKKAEHDRALFAQSQSQSQAGTQYSNFGGQYGYGQYARDPRQGASSGYNGQNFQNAQYVYHQNDQNAYAQNAKFMQQQSAQWMKKVAKAQADGYARGYETGFGEARTRLGMETERQRLEIETLKTTIEEIRAEAKKTKKEHGDIAIEYEALKILKKDSDAKHEAREKELKSEIRRLEHELSSTGKRSESDEDSLKRIKEKLAAAEDDREGLMKSIRALEKELGEATAKLFKKETAITDLKLENSRITGEKNFYENECSKLKASISEKDSEIEMLNGTIAEWENFSDSLNAAEALKNLKGQWDKTLKDTKKKLKNTHYGTLGVLYNASAEEIKASFEKLAKKYTKKAETDKEFKEKLFAAGEAYKVLSDPEKRKEYHKEIGVTDEEIAEFDEQSRRHAENVEKLEQEQGEHEFWAYVEDLMYNAQTGDAESQNTLGEMYYTGDELDRDAEQAVYWFKEAAKSKYPEAFYNLGICFLTGDGVEKDEEKAKGFIKQAEKFGSERAKLLIECGYDLTQV